MSHEVHTSIHIYIYVGIYMYIYIGIHMYIYLFMYTYRDVIIPWSLQRGGGGYEWGGRMSMNMRMGIRMQYVHINIQKRTYIDMGVSLSSPHMYISIYKNVHIYIWGSRSPAPIYSRGLLSLAPPTIGAATV